MESRYSINAVCRTMTSQRCPYPEYWIPWLCYISGQGGGIKVADGIKVAVDLEMRGHPRLSGLAQGNNKGPSKCRREWEEWVFMQCERDNVMWLVQPLLALRMEALMSQGNAGSSQHWKRQENILLTSRKDHSPSNTSILELSNVYLWCFNPKVGGHLLKK